IHLPGSIQPGGVLLALAGEPPRIVCASANLRQHFGNGAEDVVGKPLSAALGEETASQLAVDLAAIVASDTPVYLRTISSPTEDGPFYPYHALAHASPDGTRILEL